MLAAQAAGQSPAAGGDVGHLGNGLHLLWTAYTHLKENIYIFVRITDFPEQVLKGE